MSSKTEKPLELNIIRLFSSDNYIIPIYQRNYAWKNPEITQLIQDIVDYIKKDKTKPYYIGSLIAYERKTEGKVVFETIDGQQRLTTLTIILSLIKNEYPEIDSSWFKELNLKFDSRKISTNTLQNIFFGISLDNVECNIAIKQGYEDAKKSLRKILDDFKLSFSDFCKYFFEQVYILRVLVPEDTDLNHYFEIMNSRGEQLEKHEILKAKCLEVLDKEDRYGFNLIWEACANMEKYIQYGFNTIQRDYIFGSDNSNTDKWNKLISQEAVFKQLKPNDTSKENIKTEVCIIDLLNPSLTQYNAVNITEEENPDRFNTIVNFSNFLLHILRIQTKENIALDDKRLIELFEPFLKDEANKKEFVKTFGYNILKGKFLFDKYIIKREFARGTDHWSLKRMKWNEQYKTISYVNSFGNEESNEDINREILMLLSMFHVSNPTLVYKHWLNAALKFVFENDNFTASEYKEYLENLAKAFLHDRFLSDESKDYFEIIYKNNGLSKNTLINISKLNQGTAVENFVFNYLDYLLWLDYRNEKQNFTVEGKTINDNRIKEFEYTFRSSVEHYYPQHPIEGNISIALTENEQNEGKIDWLNSFGNLCLISNSKNSRLSNYMPSAKKEHYNNSPTLDSVKQRIMMEYSAWDICGDNNINEIEDHDIKMKKLIIE